MTMYEILNDGAAMAAVGDVTGDNQLPVHGVLFGTDDVTTGLTGKPTRWPAEVLETMADDGIFEGKPITVADSLDPEQHVGVEMTDDGPMLTGAVSMDEKVGEITATDFDEDLGLLFEGFLADWEAEETVESGLAQISPVVIREVELVEGEEGEDDALYEPTAVQGARDVALVADGAVPSNEINVGASPDIGADMAEALSSRYGVDVEALADGDTDNHPGGDDGSHGGSSQSTPANDDDTPTMELTDKEQELVLAARQKNDPTVVEAEVPDRLNEIEAEIDEHEDLIEEAADVDEPTVADADEVAAMQDRVAIVEGMMAEALTEQKGLREATVEAMSFEAMASEFETDEGDLNVEALTQAPETGSGPVGSSGGSSGPTDDDIERINEIKNKLDTVGTALPNERVEALRDEAASLADADDYNGALEVL